MAIVVGSRFTKRSASFFVLLALEARKPRRMRRFGPA